jgi:hypothetical protein
VGMTPFKWRAASRAHAHVPRWPATLQSYVARI